MCTLTRVDRHGAHEQPRPRRAAFPNPSSGPRACIPRGVSAHGRKLSWGRRTQRGENEPTWLHLSNADCVNPAPGRKRRMIWGVAHPRPRAAPFRLWSLEGKRGSGGKFRAGAQSAGLCSLLHNQQEPHSRPSLCLSCSGPNPGTSHRIWAEMAGRASLPRGGLTGSPGTAAPSLNKSKNSWLNTDQHGTVLGPSGRRQ